VAQVEERHLRYQAEMVDIHFGPMTRKIRKNTINNKSGSNPYNRSSSGCKFAKKGWQEVLEWRWVDKCASFSFGTQKVYLQIHEDERCHIVVLVRRRRRD
jgi:hypothetical protein